MIKTLERLGVEPQAIEQPLDLSVPENKMMLAFYLATPEIENDRRSLNVMGGMRRARKEGRWVSGAPKGYENKRDEHNKPIIVPDKNAQFIRQAFEEMSTGICTQEEVRKKLVKNGFDCSRNRFNEILRDPVYIGKIKITAYKDEAEYLVNGLHEAIIDEHIFYKVQNVLNGKRTYPVIQSKHDNFPLRGFVICNECGGNLTASISKGNGGRYYYYHCRGECKMRFKADVLNNAFADYIESIKIEKGIAELFRQILIKKITK